MKTWNSLAVLFFSCCMVAACAFNRLPSESDLSAIQQGRKSLALLRVTCKIEGESAAEPSSGCVSGENAAVAMGSFNSGGMLEPLVLPMSLSAEIREQGWVYLIMEPGIYYLGFQGQRRTDAVTYNAQWNNVQKYRVDIEPDAQVVYIGTMHLECRSAWFLFGAKYCCFIDHQIVKNEETLARKLVSDYFSAMDPPTTALMQPHTGKTLFFRTPKAKD